MGLFKGRMQVECVEMRCSGERASLGECWSLALQCTAWGRIVMQPEHTGFRHILGAHACI